MPYRLKASEPVPDGIRRIVHEEIDYAIDQLQRGTGKKRDEAIHETRKSLKKIRGALRLVQPELGGTYRIENAWLGELGRKLSEARDAAAMLEVLDSLAEKHKRSFPVIRRALEKTKRENDRGAEVRKLMQSALSDFGSLRNRVPIWSLQKDGFGAIAPGLEKRYRRGSKALGLVEQDPSPENFHEWRKRVKDHWYHLHLLEGLSTKSLEAREADLKNLQTWLGDDHNLHVLRGKLEAHPEQFGDEKEIRPFLMLVDEEQRELREKALGLGHSVYKQKPGVFVRNVSQLWDDWRKPVKKQPTRVTPPRAKNTAIA